MSSALVRQALAFVDQEETKVKEKKRVVTTSLQHRNIGQVSSHPYKKRSKKQTKAIVSSKEGLAEENIKKFLALSTPTADKAVANKIIERAIKGKPLVEKIEVKDIEDKSILFPEENLKKLKKSRFSH